MAFEETILKLSRQLYPTGRAFRMPVGGNFEKLHKGLAKSESRAYADALSILDSSLPDNSNFTTQDATDWERRLGLITNTSVLLTERKAAIARKMNHPGTIKPRQNYRYLQRELQAAGFNLFVYENRFSSGGGYITKTVGEVTSGVGVGNIQHGEIQHGEIQHGGVFSNFIANYISESEDSSFAITNLRNTFFVGGNPIGTFVNISTNRKNELRQLILRVKPVQTIGYLLINYV